MNKNETIKLLIEKDDVKEVQKAIKGGLNLNAPLSEKRYPLHWAVIYGSLNCLHLLLKNKVDVNVRTPQGWTAAHIAAIKGHDSCIQILLKHGAHIMCRDLHGSTPLHMVVAHGHTYTLQSILRSGIDENATDNNRWTAVHHASFHGRLNCLQILHKWGASLEEVNSDGNTPAHLAASEGHLSCLKFLVSTCHGGMNHVLGYRNDEGQSLRMLAERFGKHRIIEYVDGVEDDVCEIDDSQYSAFPAHAAAYQGDLATLKELIEQGIVSVNERDDKLATPAHKAAGNGQVKCLQWLIETGGDMSLVSGAGETPRDVALRYSQLVCVRMLENCCTHEDFEDEKAPRTSENIREDVCTPNGETEDKACNGYDGEDDVTQTQNSILTRIRTLEEALTEAKEQYGSLGGKLEELERDSGRSGKGESGEITDMKKCLEQERLRKERLQVKLVESRRQLSQLMKKFDEVQYLPDVIMHEEVGVSKIDKHEKKKRSRREIKAVERSRSSQGGVFLTTATTPVPKPKHI